MLNKQIDLIVELVRGKLESGHRVTLGALTVIDVHGKSLVLYSKTPRPDSLFKENPSIQNMAYSFINNLFKLESSLKRLLCWVLKESGLERFHCTQISFKIYLLEVLL